VREPGMSFGWFGLIYSRLEKVCGYELTIQYYLVRGCCDLMLGWENRKKRLDLRRADGFEFVEKLLARLLLDFQYGRTF
jgi:hypothetical protein